MPLQPRDRWPVELENELCQYLEVSKVAENFVTQDEHTEIMMSMFHTFTTPRHYKGGTFKFEKFDIEPIYEILYPKLSKMYSWLNKKDYFLSGNGYITATNYALHMDSCNPTTYFNYGQLSVKSFLLPLFVCKPENDKDSKFVLFKNRLFGWECNFSNGSSNDVKLAYQQNVTDYNGFPWIDENGDNIAVDSSKLAVTEEVYEKHLSHLPKETYYGMILEKIVPYKPLDMIFFDPYQPHVTGDRAWSKTKLKGGIRFNITRRFNA